MAILRALIGIAFFVGVAWLLSSKKKHFPLRVVLYGVGMQVALAFFCLKTTFGVALFQHVAGFVTKLISMTIPGTKLVFGGMSEGNFSEGGWGYAFAFASSGLTVIIFFSALMSILYHMGIMQILIYGLARIMTALMGVSGAESMAMAANVFVGQTEAPLVVKPYVPLMTKSELNAMMTGGFATIAGSVLAVYMGVLGEELGPHLLTASVMSAPAAFLIAKVMLPETEESATGSKVELKVERTASNVIEAAAIGTSDGVKLWLNVIAMLIAFMGLVQLFNWPLGSLGEAMELSGGLSLERIFGWVFAPVAWCMGVEGWSNCEALGTLLGTKIAVNEFIAFDGLNQLTTASEAAAQFAERTGTIAASAPHGLAGFVSVGAQLSVGLAADGLAQVSNVATEAVVISQKTATMAAYALCGFANFASVGIQIGGISPLAPERRGEISALALRAMLGGAFASWMTATIAGAFL